MFSTKSTLVLAACLLGVVAFSQDFSSGSEEKIFNRKMLSYTLGTAGKWSENMMDANCLQDKNKWFLGAFGKKLGIACIRPASLLQNFPTLSPPAPKAENVVTFQVMDIIMTFSGLTEPELFDDNEISKWRTMFVDHVAKATKSFISDTAIYDFDPRNHKISFMFRMPESHETAVAFTDALTADPTGMLGIKGYGDAHVMNVVHHTVDMPASADYMTYYNNMPVLPSCPGGITPNFPKDFLKRDSTLNCTSCPLYTLIVLPGDDVMCTPCMNNGWLITRENVNHEEFYNPLPMGNRSLYHCPSMTPETWEPFYNEFILQKPVTDAPTAAPTSTPTSAPTSAPTNATSAPTAAPTSSPTSAPTATPTATPATGK